jgi:hypothetical protein
MTADLLKHKQKGRKMNKTSRLAFALLAILALAAVAPLQAQPCRYLPCGSPMTVDLKVNRSSTVGSVTISNDNSFVYVNYTAQPGYLLTSLNLAVKTSLNAIPHSSSGAPQVSSFPYAATFNPGVSTYSFAIPRSTFPATGQLYVAAEAVVFATAANRHGSGGGDDDCDDHRATVAGDSTDAGGSTYQAEASVDGSVDKHNSGGGDDCSDRSIFAKTYGGHDDDDCSCTSGLVAWGNGTRFQGSRDAMYFKYTLQGCGGE